MEMVLDIIAICVSVLAIIVSLVTVIWVQKKSEEREKHNLHSEFYKEIFFDYLVKQIPEKRKNVGFDKKGCFWPSYKTFNQLLTDIRKDILYFSYIDTDFYSSLNDELLALDELLVKTSQQKNVNYREKEAFQKKFDEKIEKVYSIIMEHYLG